MSKALQDGSCAYTTWYAPLERVYRNNHETSSVHSYLQDGSCAYMTWYAAPFERGSIETSTTRMRRQVSKALQEGACVYTTRHAIVCALL